MNPALAACMHASAHTHTHGAHKHSPLDTPPQNHPSVLLPLPDPPPRAPAPQHQVSAHSRRRSAGTAMQRVHTLRPQKQAESSRPRPWGAHRRASQSARRHILTPAPRSRPPAPARGPSLLSGPAPHSAAAKTSAVPRMESKRSCLLAGK